MHSLSSTTREQYAFFDVDETVISIKSMFSFIKFYFSHYPNKNLEQTFNTNMDILLNSDVSREEKNASYYTYFKNLSVTEIASACKLWFDSNIRNEDTFYNKNIIDRIKSHQYNGVKCVFVSGSFSQLLEPIAEDLGIDHILCINLEKDNFSFTGKIIPPQTIGLGKAEALRTFLEKQNSDARECFAYGDDISDIPMLEAVGSPKVVSGQTDLEEYARKLNWEIINPS